MEMGRPDAAFIPEDESSPRAPAPSWIRDRKHPGCAFWGNGFH